VGLHVLRTVYTVSNIKITRQDDPIICVLLFGRIWLHLFWWIESIRVIFQF